MPDQSDNLFRLQKISRNFGPENLENVGERWIPSIQIKLPGKPMDPSNNKQQQTESK
jgi:hypothetical protein